MRDSKNIVVSYGFVLILFVGGNRMDMLYVVVGDDNVKVVKKL